MCYLFPASFTHAVYEGDDTPARTLFQQTILEARDPCSASPHLSSHPCPCQRVASTTGIRSDLPRQSGDPTGPRRRVAGAGAWGRVTGSQF